MPVFSLAAGTDLPGAREAAMAGLCSYSKPGWYGLSNPASLALCRKPVAGISYNNRFSVKGLGTGSLYISLPAGRSSLAASWSRFGNADYSRHRAALASGVQLSERIFAGISADFVAERCSGDYGQWNRITFAAGIIVKTSEKGFAAVSADNPFARINDNNLPSRIAFEYSHVLNRNFSMCAGMEMCAGQKPAVKTGFEYGYGNGLFIRGGFSSLNRSFCAGTGFEMKKIRMDVSFTTHERLGISTWGGMAFVF